MNCWEVLGIDPDSDKKTIKIAYAKLLKVHRPDEDPEGFQQLHKAYKNALQWVPVDYSQDNTPWMTDDGKPTYVGDEPKPLPELAVTKDTVETTLKSDDVSRVNEELSVSNPAGFNEVSKTVEVVEPSPLDPSVAPTEFTLEAQQFPDAIWSEPLPTPTLSPEDEALLAEINNQEESLEQDWDTLYTKVNEIVKSPKQANELASWQFIEALPSMRDLEFRKATADKVFEVVAELNEASLEQKNLYIKRPIINYLNNLFGWDVKWQQYEYHYSRTMLDAVFPYLEESEKPAKVASQGRKVFLSLRFYAFTIDMSILIIAALVIGIVANFFGDNVFMRVALGWWLAIYVLLLIPALESSPLQGTIGKHINGLQVMTVDGKRLSFFHALWRCLATVFCCLAIKIVMFINIALIKWRSELLQDTLSRSYVTLKSVP